jgi:hypothetical protein
VGCGDVEKALLSPVLIWRKSMKALLIRVGFDTGWGGILAPIFKDGGFFYFPVPEESKDLVRLKNEKRSYLEIKGSEYLPKDELIVNGKKMKITECKIHYDPEFETFTYGDHTKKGRGGAVKKLEEGDYIIFSEGFIPHSEEIYKDKTLKSIRKAQSKKDKQICIIGYFKVDICKKYEDVSECEKNIFKNNAHMKRCPPDDDLILIKGNPNDSRLLKKAFCISKVGFKKNRSKHYVSSDEFQKLTGVGCKQVQRGCRWIYEEEKIKNLLNLLVSRYS